jgi:hypothetical protein
MECFFFVGALITLIQLSYQHLNELFIHAEKKKNMVIKN